MCHIGYYRFECLCLMKEPLECMCFCMFDVHASIKKNEVAKNMAAQREWKCDCFVIFTVDLGC